MAKTMNELLDIINASDPESGEEFLKLLQPEKYDRYEMGAILEATIGNDLTCYYDKDEINKYLDFIMKHEYIDDEIKAYIQDNRDEIIRECYNDFDGQRAIHLHGTVDGYLETVLGLCDDYISDIIGDEDLNVVEGENGMVRFDTVEADDEETDVDPDEFEDADDEVE